MEKTLQSYTPVSLEQMKAVRLMNRIDTKYVTTLPKLVRLLETGRVTFSREVQSRNAALPSSLTELGRSASFKEVQPSKQ